MWIELVRLALEHAGKACELATCDGPPDHTYKAAYEEAGAKLGKEIGNRKWEEGNRKWEEGNRK